MARFQVGGRSLGGRIAGSLFYLVFFIAGLFMTAMFARAWWQGARSYGWDRHECTVLESAYATNPDGSSSERYRTTVRYRYEWQGASHEGAVERTFSDATEAQVFRDRYPPEARVRCFVDPGEPAESRLTRPSPFAILILLFPLIFVGAGGVPLYFTWRREPAAPATPKARPLTERGKSSFVGGCVMVGFFGVFFCAGAAVLWWLMLGPLYKISKARAWESTPCTVVSSQLGAQSGDDGTTYRVEVLYRYVYGGRDYESSRYDFETAYSSGSGPKQAIVDLYAPGASCTCFVDPQEPARAVLNRDFHKSYWAGLFGLPFLLVGLFGGLWVMGALRSGEKAASFPAAPARRVEFSTWRESTAPLELRPKSGPWKKLLGSLLVNLFWNGIVAVFIVVLSREWRAGNHEWMPILILTPFVLIGLLILSGLPFAFLALFNPRPWIELERANVVPGESVGARYRLSGSAGRVGRLTIVLEGREAVTVTTHSGNSTSISRREGLFHRSVLFDSGAGGAPRQAAFSLAVPAGLMHTFASSNNAVEWKIKVHGDIPRFPDLDDEFAIEVSPGEVGR